jgi:hypothetical protein
VTVLEGAVTRAGGAPATDAVVELRNSSGDVVDQVMVDDHGRYVYHLRGGKWVLRAWDARGGRARQMVELVSGEDKTMDLELREDPK